MSPVTTENLAARLRQARRNTRLQQAIGESSARELVVVAFLVPVVTVAVLAVVALAVLLLAGSGLTGLGSAIGSLWLAVHQVPVTLSGVTVGVLPILPTALVAAATAVVVATTVDGERTWREVVSVVGAAVGGALLTTALALAVVMDGSSVLPVQSPNALGAFGATIGVHVAAALAGLAWREARSGWLRRVLGPADRRGVRWGLFAVVALLTAGAVLVTVRLVLRWSTVGELLSSGVDFDGFLGLTVLSILYLPNVIVGASGVLIGSDAHVGTASVDLLSVRGGAVPPVPVLGVLPESAPGTLGALGFAVPAVIGVVVAWKCRDLDLVANLRSVGVAAAVSTTLVVVLSAVSGGRLGEIGDVGVTVPTVGVFTLGWIAVTGTVVAFIHACLPSTRAARTAVESAEFAAYADDVDDSEYGFDDEYLTDEYADDEYLADENEDDEYDGEYADDDDAYDDGDDEYDDGDDEYAADAVTESSDDPGDDTAATADGDRDPAGEYVTERS